MDKDKTQKKKNKAVEYITGKGFYTVIGISLAVVVAAAWFISARVAGRNDSPTSTSSRASSLASSPVISSQPGLSSETHDPQSDAGVMAPASEPAAGSQPGDGQPVDGPASSPQTTVKEEDMLFILPCNGKIIREHSGGLPVYSPTFSDWRVHNAVDIAGEVGTPVRAIAAGVVTGIENDLIWGTRITVTHDNGYVSVYANLGAKPTVKQDSVVECGQVIGSIGTTAKAEIADEAHLHFSLTKDGVSLDPIVVISSRADLLTE